jgi:uncharacterized RmlC-like cupin family protein
MAEITVLPGASLDEATPTPGMVRRDGLLAGHLRVIHVTTAPGSTSAWHHHAEHDTVGYVLAGRLRFEWGPDGERRVDAGPGDFFRVPPNVVHRESNPDELEQHVVGFRIGTGVNVVNVDGPDASSRASQE